ncbi:MAG: outer membrane beta-barrel protein [Pseudomonadota bacterium]
MFIKLKQIATAAVILMLSGYCYAIGPGWYFGLGAGTTDVHAKTFTFNNPGGDPPTLDISPSTTGIGERLFFGYHINPYAGLEFGFEHYGNATYKLPNGFEVSCNDPSIRENGFDMEGVASLPLVKSGFSVFAKLGMAVMYAGSSGSLEGDKTLDPCGSGTSSKAAARPLYGVGVSYDLTQNWVTDISFTRVNGGGNIQTADMIALSFSYHIVDEYCGQFLC